jgi:hypothetical protein
MGKILHFSLELYLPKSTGVCDVHGVARITTDKASCCCGGLVQEVENIAEYEYLIFWRLQWTDRLREILLWILAFALFESTL